MQKGVTTPSAPVTDTVPVKLGGFVMATLSQKYLITSICWLWHQDHTDLTPLNNTNFPSSSSWYYWLDKHTRTHTHTEKWYIPYFLRLELNSDVCSVTWGDPKSRLLLCNIEPFVLWPSADVIHARTICYAWLKGKNITCVGSSRVVWGHV